MPNKQAQVPEDRSEAQRLEEEYLEFMAAWRTPVTLPVRPAPVARPLEPRIVASVTTYGAYEDPI